MPQYTWGTLLSYRSTGSSNRMLGFRALTPLPKLFCVFVWILCQLQFHNEPEFPAGVIGPNTTLFKWARLKCVRPKYSPYSCSAERREWVNKERKLSIFALSLRNLPSVESESVSKPFHASPQRGKARSSGSLALPAWIKQGCKVCEDVPQGMWGCKARVVRMQSKGCKDVKQGI